LSRANLRFWRNLRRASQPSILSEANKEKSVTPINIVIPESLTAQKAELETTLTGIATEEQKLATQRKDIQVALQSISAAVAILTGQPLPANKAVAGIATARKPMSEEAKKRIGEGLRKYREAKALAKAAQLAAPALLASAPEPADAPVAAASEAPVEVPADAQIAAPASEEPADAPAEAPLPDSPRALRATRKGARA
jgi:hypothetical protein